jgi:multiple sugar transport system ATP-binding protein
MIAGFEAADAGDILIDGQRMNDIPAGGRPVGIVFQDYAVFTRLSVRQNLAFGLEARGVPGAQRLAAVEQMARRLDLTDLLEVRGESLNVSELQRVALGRALVTQPRLLLLDEPMASLDSGLRAQLRGEIRRLQRALRQTVLYVTHDQVEALAMSDRIAVMDAGGLLQVGTPDEVYHRPHNRFVAEFLGEPPINILPCTVRDDGGDVVASTARHTNLRLGSNAAAAGQHLLGIRPHDVEARAAASAGTAPAVVRIVENLGAEHVLHVEYGDGLLRVLVPPGTAAVDDIVHIRFDLRRALLFRRATGQTFTLGPVREAA